MTTLKLNKFRCPILRNFKKTDVILSRFLGRTATRIVVEHDSEYDFTKVHPPTQTQVIICGGGVVGCSVAYHLAKDYGWKDVVLLDQGRLSSGTTWHAAGLLGQLKQSLSETKMCQYSIALYKSMEARGLSTGWKECGSLMLAQTRDRMISFQRMASSAQARNVECEILTPDEAKNLCQLINADNLQGALWIPGDGVGDPIEACLSLAGEAYRMGVQIVENCSVKRVLVDQRLNIRGVETNKGTIMCKYFVNSGGFWAPNIGQLSEPKVRVPTYPCEHHYLHTMPIKGLDPNIPVIRDFDGCFYVREKEGRIIAGGFEPAAKPLDMKQMPNSFAPLPEDWDQFHVLLEQMLDRIPMLKDAKVDRLCNAAENFTPDCKWLLGETPEIKNYFIACGMKSIGMEAAGGVGQATAEWIVHGEPQRDLWDLDIRRFVGLHNNRLFLKDRMKEVPGLHYGIYYPFRQFETGRCLRMPPIYPRLKAAGAYFGQKMGYERPCYFAPDKFSSTDPLELGRVAHTKTFGKPSWFDYCKSEYQACRERVGLLDYSSFTKIELWSPGKEVVDFLQYLCSNDINIPTGSIAHTGMQNKWGGYENDCSIVRLADNQGPHSRDLLGDLTDTTMTPKDFPFFTYKEVDIGLASGIRAMNLTHTGELGWVLYIPNEYALHVYEHILEIGKKYGIQHAGYFAMRTLRIEKFYAFWGKDLDTTTTPLECGRSFRVKFQKGDFIGKEALLKQKEQGVTRRYIQLVLEDHNIDNEIWPWGDEPIYLNDKRVGSTTTTGYGFTLGKHVCLGFIHNFSEDGTPQVVSNDYILKNQFEINIAGRRYPAKANIHSPKLNFVELGYDSSYMATR